MYWRRFAVSSIPLDDTRAFESWLRERWIEKDALLDLYMQTGRFPPTQEANVDATRTSGHAKGEGSDHAGYIETTVRQVHWWEVGQIFAFLAVFALLAKLLATIRRLLSFGVR